MAHAGVLNPAMAYSDTFTRASKLRICVTKPPDRDAAPAPVLDYLRAVLNGMGVRMWLSSFPFRCHPETRAQ